MILLLLRAANSVRRWFTGRRRSVLSVAARAVAAGPACTVTAAPVSRPCVLGGQRSILAGPVRAVSLEASP